MPLDIQQLIKDESGDRDYFAMVPGLLWPDIKLCSGSSTVEPLPVHVQELGIELNIYDKWLYASLKKICGEKGGQCFLSTRGLAKFVGMSVGQTSKSKAKLAEAGLIEIVCKKRSVKGQAIDHITVVDVWEENIKLMKARKEGVHLVNALEAKQERSQKGEERSPDEHQPPERSQGESKCSQGETEEEPIEEEPKGEEEKEEKPSVSPEPPCPAPASLARENGEPLDAGLDLYWQHCREAEANQKAGGNYADPDSFALGDKLIAAACARLGRSEPTGKKRDNAVAFFEKALKDEGLLQGDMDTLTGAVKDWLDPEGEYAFFLPQYDLNPKHELALRHFGIVLSKAKKVADATPDRHARYDTEAVRASQAALEERKAGRPPPAKDDAVGKQIKAELQLQMTRATFDAWVKPAGFICGDGALTVTAPDENVKGWLADRLATTIRRAAVGVVGRPVEVVLEVES